MYVCMYVCICMSVGIKVLCPTKSQFRQSAQPKAVFSFIDNGGTTKTCCLSAIWGAFEKLMVVHVLPNSRFWKRPCQYLLNRKQTTVFSFIGNGGTTKTCCLSAIWGAPARTRHASWRECINQNQCFHFSATIFPGTCHTGVGCCIGI